MGMIKTFNEFINEGNTEEYETPDKVVLPAKDDIGYAYVEAEFYNSKTSEIHKKLNKRKYNYESHEKDYSVVEDDWKPNKKF